MKLPIALCPLLFAAAPLFAQNSEPTAVLCEVRDQYVDAKTKEQASAVELGFSFDPTATAEARLASLQFFDPAGLLDGMPADEMAYDKAIGSMGLHFQHDMRNTLTLIAQQQGGAGPFEVVLLRQNLDAQPYRNKSKTFTGACDYIPAEKFIELTALPVPAEADNAPAVDDIPAPTGDRAADSDIEMEASE